MEPRSQGNHAFAWPCRTPRRKEGVEPKPLREPLRQGVQNVPWPTPPYGGAATRHCFCIRERSQFSRKQHLDARASISSCRDARSRASLVLILADFLSMRRSIGLHCVFRAAKVYPAPRAQSAPGADFSHD
jgi:hypothetical protein